MRSERGKLQSVPIEKLVVVVDCDCRRCLKGMALCTLACLPLQPSCASSFCASVFWTVMAAVLSGVMLLLIKALRPRVALQQKHGCSDQTVTYQSVANNISVSELSPSSQKMVEQSVESRLHHSSDSVI